MIMNDDNDKWSRVVPYVQVLLVAKEIEVQRMGHVVGSSLNGIS